MNTALLVVVIASIGVVVVVVLVLVCYRVCGTWTSETVQSRDEMRSPRDQSRDEIRQPRDKESTRGRTPNESLKTRSCTAGLGGFSPHVDDSLPGSVSDLRQGDMMREERGGEENSDNHSITEMYYLSVAGDGTFTSVL